MSKLCKLCGPRKEHSKSASKHKQNNAKHANDIKRFKSKEFVEKKISANEHKSNMHGESSRISSISESYDAPLLSEDFYKNVINGDEKRLISNICIKSENIFNISTKYASDVKVTLEEKVKTEDHLHISHSENKQKILNEYTKTNAANIMTKNSENVRRDIKRKYTSTHKELDVSCKIAKVQETKALTQERLFVQQTQIFDNSLAKSNYIKFAEFIGNYAYKISSYLKEKHFFSPGTTSYRIGRDFVRKLQGINITSVCSTITHLKHVFKNKSEHSNSVTYDGVLDALNILRLIRNRSLTTKRTQEHSGDSVRKSAEDFFILNDDKSRKVLFNCLNLLNSAVRKVNKFMKSSQIKLHDESLLNKTSTDSLNQKVQNLFEKKPELPESVNNTEFNGKQAKDAKRNYENISRKNLVSAKITRDDQLSTSDLKGAENIESSRREMGNLLKQKIIYKDKEKSKLCTSTGHSKITERESKINSSKKHQQLASMEECDLLKKTIKLTFTQESIENSSLYADQLIIDEEVANDSASEKDAQNENTSSENVNKSSFAEKEECKSLLSKSNTPNSKGKDISEKKCEQKPVESSVNENIEKPWDFYLRYPGLNKKYSNSIKKDKTKSTIKSPDNLLNKTNTGSKRDTLIKCATPLVAINSQLYINVVDSSSVNSEKQLKTNANENSYATYTVRTNYFNKETCEQQHTSSSNPESIARAYQTKGEVIDITGDDSFTLEVKDGNVNNKEERVELKNIQHNNNNQKNDTNSNREFIASFFNVLSRNNVTAEDIKFLLYNLKTCFQTPTKSKEDGNKDNTMTEESLDPQLYKDILDLSNANKISFDQQIKNMIKTLQNKNNSSRYTSGSTDYNSSNELSLEKRKSITSVNVNSFNTSESTSQNLSTKNKSAFAENKQNNTLDISSSNFNTNYNTLVNNLLNGCQDNSLAQNKITVYSADDKQHLVDVNSGGLNVVDKIVVSDEIKSNSNVSDTYLSSKPLDMKNSPQTKQVADEYLQRKPSNMSQKKVAFPEEKTEPTNSSCNKDQLAKVTENTFESNDSTKENAVEKSMRNSIGNSVELQSNQATHFENEGTKSISNILQVASNTKNNRSVLPLLTPSRKVENTSISSKLNVSKSTAIVSRETNATNTDSVSSNTLINSNNNGCSEHILSKNSKNFEINNLLATNKEKEVIRNTDTVSFTKLNIYNAPKMLSAKESAIHVLIPFATILEICIQYKILTKNQKQPKEQIKEFTLRFRNSAQNLRFLSNACALDFDMNSFFEHLFVELKHIYKDRFFDMNFMKHMWYYTMAYMRSTFRDQYDRNSLLHKFYSDLVFTKLEQPNIAYTEKLHSLGNINSEADNIRISSNIEHNANETIKKRGERAKDKPRCKAQVKAKDTNYTMADRSKNSVSDLNKVNHSIAVQETRHLNTPVHYASAGLNLGNYSNYKCYSSNTSTPQTTAATGTSVSYPNSTTQILHNIVSSTAENTNLRPSNYNTQSIYSSSNHTPELLRNLLYPSTIATNLQTVDRKNHNSIHNSHCTTLPNTKVPNGYTPVCISSSSTSSNTVSPNTIPLNLYKNEHKIHPPSTSETIANIHKNHCIHKPILNTHSYCQNFPSPSQQINVRSIINQNHGNVGVFAPPISQFDALYHRSRGNLIQPPAIPVATIAPTSLFSETLRRNPYTGGVPIPNNMQSPTIPQNIDLQEINNQTHKKQTENRYMPHSLNKDVYGSNYSSANANKEASSIQSQLPMPLNNFNTTTRSAEHGRHSSQPNVAAMSQICTSTPVTNYHRHNPLPFYSNNIPTANADKFNNIQTDKRSNFKHCQRNPIAYNNQASYNKEIPNLLPAHLEQMPQSVSNISPRYPELRRCPPEDASLHIRSNRSPTVHNIPPALRNISPKALAQMYGIVFEDTEKDLQHHFTASNQIFGLKDIDSLSSCSSEKNSVESVTNYENIKSSCQNCHSLGYFVCSICKLVFYCSKECQKAHWEAHQPFCLK